MGNRRLREKNFVFPLYYGWAIVFVASLSMGVWLAMRTTFSLFLVALLEEFPWSRAAAAGVQSVSFIVYTCTAPLVGALIDRFGPKPVILPGILLLCLGLVLSSFVQTLTQFYVSYGIIVACGVTTVSIIAYSAILSNWFERKRGLANGIAVAGMGLVIMLLSPLTQFIINQAGWRVAFLALAGLVFLLLFPLSALLLKHKPLDREEEMKGFSEESQKNRGLVVRDESWANRDWTLKEAMREGRYWSFIAFVFFSIFPVYMIIIHLAKMLDDLGFDPMYAAVLIVVVGIIASVFKLIWGWLSDYLGRELVATAGLMSLAGGTFVLLLLNLGSPPWLLYLFVFLFGCGWAVLAPTNMSVSADLFQGRSYGLIYGSIESVSGLAQAIGPWLAGLVFDRTGSYLPALMFGTAASLAAIPFIWSAAPRKVRGVGRG